MKYALVTGGSRGIGRAVSLRLAQSGLPVVVNYVNNEVAADETLALIRQAGGQAEKLRFDVASPEAVEEGLARWSEAHPEDTLESNLYYLDSKSFLLKIYKQMKARVKINILEEKKSLTGKPGKRYVTRTLSVEALAGIPASEKEKQGVVVQELILSKLALASF